MKRIYAFILAIVILFSCTACSRPKQGGKLSAAFTQAAAGAGSSSAAGSTGTDSPADTPSADAPADIPEDPGVPADDDTADPELADILELYADVDIASSSHRMLPREPFSGDVHADVAYADLSYEIYDTERFETVCDAFASCQDYETAVKLYNWLYDQFLYASTQYSICYIEYSKNVNDKTLQADHVTTEQIYNSCEDLLRAAVRDCLSGPIGAEFAAYMGAETSEYYTDYENLTDRMKELTEQEGNLVARYYELMSDTASYTYEYDGRQWTASMLNSIFGARLTVEEWYRIRDGINKAINDEVGPVYVELVQVRDELAKLKGYDNYNDYAYEEEFGRDYTPEQAQLFCDAVKSTVGPAFFNSLYDHPLAYEDTSFNAQGSEIFELVGQYAGRLDSRFTEVHDYLTQYGLTCIDRRPSMMDGGYTTTLDMYGEPFIFISMAGTLYDVSTAVHEFGHSCDMYYNQPRDMLQDQGSYDIFEIHSTGMEIMFHRFYPEIFGSRASVAEFNSLLNLVYCVIDGCIFDEFQRTIYANPDMTLDEINQLYYDLCVEYGQTEYTDADYYWMNVHHNYESPLYYLSYGASALVSLQLWDMQQVDPDAALDAYLEIVGIGAYQYGYMEMLDMVGLRSFADEGAVEEICMPVIEYCAALR